MQPQNAVTQPHKARGKKACSAQLSTPSSNNYHESDFPGLSHLPHTTGDDAMGSETPSSQALSKRTRCATETRSEGYDDPSRSVELPAYDS